MKSERKANIQMQGTTAAELIQFLQAAHVGLQTDWGFQAAGGIMLVSPPEGLKTTLVELAYDQYTNAEVMGDINARKLGNMRDRILAGKRLTFAFSDYQKIWERDQDTAANVEGIIRALVEEGWRGHSEGSEFAIKARAMCVLCCTPSFAERNYKKWEDSGMARRFLFLQYQFFETDVLVDAIRVGHPYQLSTDAQIRWPSVPYPLIVTDLEFETLKLAIKDQFGVTLPLQFAKRILNVLKHHYRQRVTDEERADENAQNVFLSVAQLMKKGGGILTARNPKLQVMNPVAKAPEPRTILSSAAERKSRKRA